MADNSWEVRVGSISRSWLLSENFIFCARLTTSVFCFMLNYDIFTVISFFSQKNLLTTLELPSALSSFNEPKVLIITILLIDPYELDERNGLWVAIKTFNIRVVSAVLGYFQLISSSLISIFVEQAAPVIFSTALFILV